MPQIVNLRQARKSKLRADKERQAAANRAKFGRTRIVRLRDAAETDRDRKRLDQVKLTPDD